MSTSVTALASIAPVGRPVAGPSRFAPVWVSPAMRAVMESAEDVAQADTTVLLLGESGTGKEVLARYIHQRSARANAAYVAVNCAALPGELLESELFGHEKGAFTGASERRTGKIELADGGTLLLDEISELPLPLQAKLLRVLQEREVDRVGGSRPLPVDVRVIATSNRDLEEMVHERLFRADLYYRLAVFPIVLPALRERREDVVPLAMHLLARLAERMRRSVPVLTPAAADALARNEFRGNVRELGNVLERALVRCRGGVIDVGLLGTVDSARSSAGGRAGACPAALPGMDTTGGESLPEGVPLELEALERLAIEAALRKAEGNRTHAARILGISLRTLRNKLRAARERGAAWASPVSSEAA